MNNSAALFVGKEQRIRTLLKKSYDFSPLFILSVSRIFIHFEIGQ